LAVTFIGALGGLVLAIPLVGSLIGSSFEKEEGHFSKVANMDALPLGQPLNVKYPDLSQDAYLRGTVSRSVWVIKHTESAATVYSPICTHLGCEFFWDTKGKQFVCPCHNSIFAMDGNLISGPAQRGLDTLATRIENGQLFVKWERFRPAISQKILA